MGSVSALTLQNFGKVQKVIFQRLKNGSTKNSITIGGGAGETDLLATWTTLQAAVDGTKIVLSPTIQGTGVTPGDKKEFGGGEETTGGIPIPLGSEFTTFEGRVLRARQDVIKELKALACEDMGVYFINECGHIGADSDDSASATTIYPIPLYSFFVGDLGFGGQDAVDGNDISWGHKPNWSDNFTVIDPAGFDPLTEL